MGGETHRLIEDVRLLMDGNIIVKDAATLTLRNTDLTRNSAYKNQYAIILHDEATLTVEDSWLRDAYGVGTPSVRDIKMGESGINVWSPDATLVMRNTGSELRMSADGDVTVDGCRETTASRSTMRHWKPSWSSLRWVSF